METARDLKAIIKKSFKERDDEYVFDLRNM